MLVVTHFGAAGLLASNCGLALVWGLPDNNDFSSRATALYEPNSDVEEPELRKQAEAPNHDEVESVQYDVIGKSTGSYHLVDVKRVPQSSVSFGPLRRKTHWFHGFLAILCVAIVVLTASVYSEQWASNVEIGEESIADAKEGSTTHDGQRQATLPEDPPEQRNEHHSGQSGLEETAGKAERTDAVIPGSGSADEQVDGEQQTQGVLPKYSDDSKDSSRVHVLEEDSISLKEEYSSSSSSSGDFTYYYERRSVDD